MSKPITLELTSADLYILANWATLNLDSRPGAFTDPAEQQLALDILAASGRYMAAVLTGKDPGT